MTPPTHLTTLGHLVTAREREQERLGAELSRQQSVRERLHYRIVYRKKEGVEADIDQAVAEADGNAVDVLNNVLLPAMKEVGDKFGAGELILPFVLQSAEVMKRAVAQLETYMERVEGTSKGVVVLATVYGDVHDIGKNLVNTILSNNGYTVHDLGKQVPVTKIIEKAASATKNNQRMYYIYTNLKKYIIYLIYYIYYLLISFSIKFIQCLQKNQNI